MEVDRNGLEVLDHDECLGLLRTVAVGRIAFSSGALPTILPIGFTLDGNRLLLRTVRGSKLDAATRNAVVAFEADHIDVSARAGWSVVITGIASEVPHDEAAVLDLSHLEHWVTDDGARVVSISLEKISGRRVRADAHAGRLRRHAG